MSAKQEKIDDFVKQFFKLLPDDLRQTRQDVEKNIRAALSSTFSQMDLITREEFDIQTSLLSRTRELVEELEGKVKELEEKLEKQNQQ